MKSTFTCFALAALVLTSVGCASTAGSPADSSVVGQASEGRWAWKYVAYDVLSAENLGAGRLELSGKPGSYAVRLVLRTPAPCAIGTSPAVVESTADALVITSTPTIKDCGVRRYTIRKDGSGGFLDVQSVTKAGSVWVRDEFDRGLTPL